MNAIIAQSIKRGISYGDYRNLMKQLVENHSNTGNEKTEQLANYTMLNDKRMKRWDKTLKVPEYIQQKIASCPRKIICLIISESWCGDAAHVMPVFNKMEALNTNIEIKIVLRDENLELMNMFLTNGSQAIAKFILLDKVTGLVLDTYGPRPTQATQLVDSFKEKHGALSPEFKEDLQQWYNKNKGLNAMEDIVKMMEAL